MTNHHRTAILPHFIPLKQYLPAELEAGIRNAASLPGLLHRALYR
jgi:hypothetical protein